MELVQMLSVIISQISLLIEITRAIVKNADSLFSADLRWGLGMHFFNKYFFDNS